MGSLNDLVRESLATKDIRPTTRRSYLVALAPFMHLDAEWLSVADLREVLDGIQNQNTRRKAVIALKSLVPLPAVKALRVPEAVAKSYNLPDETTLRLALLTTPHQTRCLLMMYVGLRLGEACAVTKDSLDGVWLTVDKQVDETSRRIVPVKTTTERVPVPDWLVPMVLGLTTPGSPKALRKSLSRAGERCGIRLNPHQLRHWCATSLVKRGTDPSVVQRLMRHKDIRITFKVYNQVNQEDLLSNIRDFGRL